MTTGKHQRGREHPGHHQVGVAVVGQRLERIDLLGDLHRAQLGGDARADPAGEGHPGEHRPQLHHHGLAHERAHEVERDRAGEDVGGEEREDDAGEDGDEDGDREGVYAEPPHLGDQERGPGADIGQGAGGLDAAQSDRARRNRPGRKSGKPRWEE